MKKKRQRAPASYIHRSYRNQVESKGLVGSVVQIGETDLHILAPIDVTLLARDLVIKYRGQLESYGARHPVFFTSLMPMKDDLAAPKIVREMLTSGQAAGVGPMAAVAGAIAEMVGHELLATGLAEIEVENGGDIFLQRQTECIIGIFAGDSPLSGKVGIRISANRMPIGICTSSGTVGHSLSLGQADAVTVLAGSTFLADAAATRIGNEVRVGEPLDHALRVGREIKGIDGVVIIQNKNLGAWGDVELVRLEQR